jgi:hypothetical protein
MRSALMILLGMLAFAFGGVLAATNMWQEWGDDFFTWWTTTATGHATASVVAGTLMTLPLLQVLRWWREWRRSREISYATENGRITVSLIAIEEALTRALEGESEVKRATVHVYEDRAKRAVIIEAKVTLWEVPNLTERNRFCQRLLRRRFAELMPEQTAVQVLITIYRIYQRKPEAKAGEAPPAAVPAPATTGKADSDVYLPDFDDLPANDDDLYHGPAYPVARDEDDEGGTALYGRPSGTVRVPAPDKKT